MNKTKKSIVVCLLAAALLVSMVGMASADPDIIWYLRSYDPVVNGADYEIHKGSGYGPADSVAIAAGESKIWVANEAAEVEVSFGTQNWRVLIDYTDEAGGGFLDNGESITVKIGSLDPVSGTFTEAMSMSEDGWSAATFGEITPGSSWSVPKDDYLALELTLTGGNGVKVDIHNVGGGVSASYIKCLGACADYPVPELPTIILMSTGLLALFGYVVYRRRTTRK